MPDAFRSYLRAAAVLAGVAALAFGLSSIGSGSTPARAASIGQLQRQINAGKGTISHLAGAVGQANGQIGRLNGTIGGLAREITRIQGTLDADRRQLLKLRSQLDAAHIRLTRLENFEARAQVLLANQLVNNYESDRPDLMTVVLDATGFENLLETLSFQKRIRQENVSVINDVVAAKRAVTAQAIRLGALEVRQQRLTVDVLRQRNQLDRDKVGFVEQELAAVHARDLKQNRLANARGRVGALERELGHLQAIQAREAAAAARAADPSAPAPSSGATPTSSFGPPASAGGFTFPLPKSAVVGPGSWSLDDGVDMAAPGGTPEYAVCSGTIVQHGIGGFGPWAPIIHCDTPIAGYSYVYYGHAGPANQLPIGTHVSAGQVMSEVGPGIVGISTGPHIEIGFATAGGGLVGPSSAPTMLSLLHSSY